MSTTIFIPSNKKLTPEIATAVLTHLKTNGVLAPNGVKYLDLQVKDSQTGLIRTETISVKTIRNWVQYNVVIIGTPKRFGDLWDKTKNDVRLMKQAKKDETIVKIGRKNLIKAMTLDPHSDYKNVMINTRRDKRSGKRIETTRMVQKVSGIDTQKLKVLVDASKFALERLDPSFQKKDETKNINVNFSFVKLAERRDEMIKEGLLERK